MKTHYDVLELAKNCTAEEIKNSYIKLSKKYHPDKNKNSDAHKRFIAVNEAYSILGKRDSRLRYDASLLHDPRMSFDEARKYGRMRTQHINYYDYVHVVNVKRSQGSSSTYFTRARMTAFLCCCFLLVVGTGIQLRNAERFRRLESHRTSLLLQHTQLRAHKMGREQAIQDFVNGSCRGISMRDVEEELDENSYNNKK